MYQELFVQTAQHTHKAFLQDGFYQNIAPTPRLHKHNYTEIHLVSDGLCRFSIGQNSYIAQTGEMLVIPAKVFHCCVEQEPSTRHRAFQIDCNAEEFSSFSLSPALVSEILRQIEADVITQNFSITTAFMALLCSYFCADEKCEPNAITDDGFLIQEFFFHHYSEDVHLRDLAEILHRSERQAERLVLAHTGHSFREELTATRLAMARYLQNTCDLSLTEIAEYVGYRSYAGFWKAFKKDTK